MEICDSPLVRTDARSCAEIEGPRARVPHTAAWEFSTATIMRSAAQPNYSERFPAAYGPHCSRTDAPHRPTGTKSPVQSTDCRRDDVPPFTLPYVAGTRHRDFFHLSHVRTRAQARAQIEPLHARPPYVAASGYFSATRLRATALKSLPARSLAEYGARPFAVQHLAQRQPPEGISHPYGRRLSLRSGVSVHHHLPHTSTQTLPTVTARFTTHLEKITSHLHFRPRQTHCRTAGADLDANL